mgnify:CR=1 FL=1
MISDVSASSGSGLGPVSDRTNSSYLAVDLQHRTHFARVLCRFYTYGIELEGWPCDYAEVVLEYSDVQELLDASQSQPWLIAHKELDVS